MQKRRGDRVRTSMARLPQLDRNMSKVESRGFTIVELLIVIVVIGILAAITIVAFNGIQNRGYDTTVQSDLKSFKTKVELYKVDNNEQYPDGSGIASLRFKASQSAYSTAPTDHSNLYYCYSTTDRSIFGLVVKSKSGNGYSITNSTGIQPYTGTYGNPCAILSAALSNNYRGYATDDTADGPWRTWVR